jgi:TfoX/Sxy family transcriptional regulator of competence genes
MAYDKELADRVRELLAGEDRVDEIPMMGGLCFMVAGHMAVGIVRDDLMVRVGPEGKARALSRAHAREMDLTGRPMRSFVLVSPAGTATKRSLASWVTPAAEYAKGLPPKRRRPGSRRGRRPA